MAFIPKIAEVIAYRAAYICSNPDCKCLTIGPSIEDLNLRNKIGQAAHIYGEKPDSARYIVNKIIKIGSAENGIWLCANCHNLIDKIDGTDYPPELLFEWKRQHEETISMLLRTHKSPLPMLYRNSSNRKIAQDVIDIISGKGAYYQDAIMENENYMIESIKNARSAIKKEISLIDSDPKLKKILVDINSANTELMNSLSNGTKCKRSHLEVHREKIGHKLKLLQDIYGCTITGNITTILP